MARVFVSSTCYDLIDLRAELEADLRDFGLDPVLSDSCTSDFVVPPDRNSIDACLLNVDASNCVLVILSQRYGPSLKNAGFPDVSATHIEYLRAVEIGKPIYFYVRDRLLADHNHWSRNGCSDAIELSWLQRPQDRPLLRLIENHKKLVEGEKGSNWLGTFRDSVELRRLVRRDLRLVGGKSLLQKLVRENRVPTVSLAVEASRIDPVGLGQPRHIGVELIFKNVGGVMAFGLRWQMADHECIFTDTPTDPLILAPQQGTAHRFLSPLANIDKCLKLMYQTPDGHHIEDHFRFYVRAGALDVSTQEVSCHLTDKKFRVARDGASPLKIE